MDSSPSVPLLQVVGSEPQKILFVIGVVGRPWVEMGNPASPGHNSESSEFATNRSGFAPLHRSWRAMCRPTASASAIDR